MGRREDRLRRKLEKNPAMECNKVRQKYCPDLFRDFADTKDPCSLSYTDYSNREMPGTMFYKGIAGIASMQAMTDEFNKDQVVKNLYRFMGGKEKEFLLHGVTVYEYFAMLDPEELQKVQQKQVYGLIRSKAFYDAGFRKKQKNISSDLLKSFGGQKTEREDIRRNDTQSVPADWSKYSRKKGCLPGGKRKNLSTKREKAGKEEA